jgi:outer membrane protein, heavy metal efflux system
LQYAQLFVLDHERDTLTDADELVRMLEATAQNRYSVGTGDQASVLRLQIERTRLTERLADLEAERHAVQTALNRLVDDPPETLVGRVATLPPTSAAPADVANLAREVSERAPDVAVRTQEAQVAARRVDAARQELKPTWSVGAGLYWQGAFDRMVTFSVGVELPFWKERKQLPLVAAADGEWRAAKLDVASAVADAQAEASHLLMAWQTADAQVERYRSALLPQTSATLDATRASYLGGRGDFASVVEEFRRWIEVRVQLARREADRFMARVRLEGMGFGQKPEDREQKTEDRIRNTEGGVQ